MNFHGIASLILSLSSFPLGVFVYLKGRNKAPNITYALIAISTALWCFGQFMGEISPDKGTALFWTRVNLAGGILVVAFFVNFVIVFLNKLSSRRWVVVITYAATSMFLLLDTTALFVSSAEPRLIFKYYPVPGPTYPLFTAFFFLAVGYGLFELAGALIRERGVYRNQIMYIFLSSVVAFAGASTLFFPVFGIDIYPIGYYFVPLYILLGVYAIVKHRLLDITIVVRRGLVYSIMVLLLSVLYVGSIYVFGEAFKNLTGFKSAIPTVVILFAFAAAFNPIREHLQTQVDRVFFREKYDFRQTMKDISGSTATILDLDELLRNVLGKLVSTVGAEGGSVFLKEPGGEEKLAGEVNWRRPGPEKSDRAVIPLVIKGEKIGSLELGAKLSEESYSDEDISLLSTLANNLSIAIENARLHEAMLEREREVYRADKLASLGTLSAGMAHEIKNPLAILKGMTQAIPENIDDKEYLRKISEIVPRQIDRIDGLVEDLISFSKPKAVRRSDVDINSIVAGAVKFVADECRKKGIAIEKDLGEGIPPLSADPELLTQAFLNLMLNAIHAMGSGGKLNISCRSSGDACQVIVTDTGSGISRENIARIFDPFFTTKEKGAGLGLAVTYRIIKEHGGDIKVESEEQKGTRFTVELPVKRGDELTP